MRFSRQAVLLFALSTLFFCATSVYAVFRVENFTSPDEVMIYLNQARGQSWQKQVISTKGSHGVQVGDVDGDGNPDMMGANWSGPDQAIEIWFNRSD